MKRVLLIKIEAPTYSSMGMEAAFKEAFEEVHSIDWQKVRFNGGLMGLENLWKEIMFECSFFKPDLIFCQFQRDILTPEQFKELSEFGFVINYTEDVREDITWYEEVAPHIGLTIFTNMDDCRKFWDKGLAASYMLVSYNHLWYKPQPKTQRNYGDIIFIGNNFSGTNLNFPQAQERVEMCKFMKEKFGNKFQAYGIGQENQMLTPMECIEAYNNCKVAITQNNFKREGYMSDRGLNSMACGAVTIHQHFDGIWDMFKDAPYLYTWNEFKGISQYCDTILYNNWFPPFESKLQTDYIIKNHSWHNRIKFIKGFIKLQTGDVADKEALWGLFEGLKQRQGKNKIKQNE